MHIIIDARTRRERERERERRGFLNWPCLSFGDGACVCASHPGSSRRRNLLRKKEGARVNPEVKARIFSTTEAMRPTRTTRDNEAFNHAAELEEDNEGFERDELVDKAVPRV